MGQVFIALLLVVLFIGCSPSFSENSPVYYDESTETTRLKEGACALPFGTKLDLSSLTGEQRIQYLGRINLNNAPDLCYNGKVSHITMYMKEINYDIPCTCNPKKATKKVIRKIINRDTL